ncbi:sulfatase-like hydrolase/transferase [Arcanobacterium hippocoleae]|uniref:sulfatase-like hydrolase/transferase n=1 Tax=Arcanobacterium hippocoleae TaxID=149017 RepID=UPI00333ECFE9
MPSLRGYAAALSGVDRAVGAIRECLRQIAASDNTVFAYMSDNGFSCGQHGLWGKGNGTYPLNFWENSVRVPFFIHLPGQTDRINVSNHVSSCSLYETICEIAGVAAPADSLRAARSIADLVRGQKRRDDETVVVFDEYGGGRMMRQGNLKFIDRYDGPQELYDLENDPEERFNLAEEPEWAEVKEHLAQILSSWFAAHEIEVNSAYDRNIRGRGQIHPPRMGFSDARTYIWEEVSLDGDHTHQK